MTMLVTADLSDLRRLIDLRFPTDSEEKQEAFKKSRSALIRMYCDFKWRMVMFFERSLDSDPYAEDEPCETSGIFKDVHQRNML